MRTISFVAAAFAAGVVVSLALFTPDAFHPTERQFLLRVTYVHDVHLYQTQPACAIGAGFIEKQKDAFDGLRYVDCVPVGVSR